MNDNLANRTRDAVFVQIDGSGKQICFKKNSHPFMTVPIVALPRNLLLIFTLISQ